MSTASAAVGADPADTAAFDVAIVGGGPVGASLALALVQEKSPPATLAPRAAPLPALRVALLEASEPRADADPEPDAWDARVYAVSAASKGFLQSLGVWQRLDPERIAPIARMQVYGDRGGRLDFSAHDAGLAELAWIVEAGALARALSAALAEPALAGRVKAYRPARPRALTLSDEAATLDLAGNGPMGTPLNLSARLVVGAEGAHSFVRDEAGIAVDAKPYAQQGVVANFACEKPHRGTAWQWFLAHEGGQAAGVLAWLPLPGRRISMVWSTPDAHAAELLALSPGELGAAVAAAGGHALGDMELITPAAAFPLALRNARHMIERRVALVGDAAHTVHPLAGHGINLGFGDAAALAAVLREARHSAGPAGADPGGRALLRRYERARAEDIMLMRATTDGLARLFDLDSKPAGWLRNTGLAWVNRAPALKNLLARHAAGNFQG